MFSIRQLLFTVFFYFLINIAGLAPLQAGEFYEGTTWRQQSKPQKAFDRDILVKNKWYLSTIEKKSHKDSTFINLNQMLQPCEKDNYTQYILDGTYSVYEGLKKCKAGDGEKKGGGTWQLEESRGTIIEDYNGGRQIEKQILKLSEDIFQIEYESRGGATTRLTFYTINEKGETSIEVDPTTEDESMAAADPLVILSRLVRAQLLEKNRYVVVSLDDLKKGAPLDIKPNQYKKTVAIYPFWDGTNDETFDETARDAEIITQAQKVGIQYVITGKLLYANTTKNQKGYRGEARYTIKILNIKMGALQYDKVLSAVASERATGFWKTLLIEAMVAMEGIEEDEDIDRIITKGIDREDLIARAAFIIQALEKTERDISKSIDDHISLRLKINQILESKKTRKGTIAKIVKLEGGENAKLKVGDKLDVTIIETIEMSNGKVVEERKPVGTLVVQSVDSMYLSTCKVSDGGLEINDLVEQKVDNLYALTTSKRSLVPSSNK